MENYVSNKQLTLEYDNLNYLYQRKRNRCILSFYPEIKIKDEKY